MMTTTSSDDPVAYVRELVDERARDGDCIVKLGAAVSVYYQGTFKENARGLVQFYRTAMSHIGPHVKFFHVDGKNQPVKLKKDTLDLLPFWASDSYPDRAIYGLSLESGPEKYEVSDKAFKLFEGIHPGQVRLVLPVDFVASDPAAFVEVARTACDELTFWSGTGGFALNTTSNYPSDLPNRRVAFVANRFLGIDVEPFGALASSADKGIKNIDWLTLVGDAFLARSGGRDGVRQRLRPLAGVVVHELQHGVMIQAGPRPAFGDVNRRERLDLYYEIGRVLKPLMIPRRELDIGDVIGGAEQSEKWVYRFFE
jgi:hypothetical protein